MAANEPDVQPRVPAMGTDPRDTTSEVSEPAGKTWFRDLDEAVIEGDRCVQCGTCVAACPSNSIGVAESDDRPTLIRMCTGCARCWDFCPRSGMRYERLWTLIDEKASEDDATGILGQVRNAVAARSTSDTVRHTGQDGGVVTSLLAELLITTGDAGIDGAIIATDSDEREWKAKAFLATTPEDVRENAGSFYNQTVPLGRISELISENETRLPSAPRLAIVGPPCVIEGVTALKRFSWEDKYGPQKPIDAITLTIALMCTRNFEYERLRFNLVSEYGIDLAEVEKMDVTEGVFSVYGTDRLLLEIPVEDLDNAALNGCAECADFAGRTADISVGSIGTGPEETSVLIRTDAGERAWQTASNSLSAAPLEDTTPLERIAERVTRRARRTLPRDFDPSGPLNISYEDHRRVYDGTDRAPRPFNSARVHQYEEWC